MRTIDADHLKRWILSRVFKTQLSVADVIDQIDREDTIDFVLKGDNKMTNKEYVEQLNAVCKPIFESIEEKIKSGEVVYFNDAVQSCKVACEKERIVFPFDASYDGSIIGWVLRPGSPTCER